MSAVSCVVFNRKNIIYLFLEFRIDFFLHFFSLVLIKSKFQQLIYSGSNFFIRLFESHRLSYFFLLDLYRLT